MIFASCTKKDSDPANPGPLPVQTPNVSKLTSSCFTASSANPVLTRDTQLAGSDWNDPSVLKVGSQFVMYASSDQNFDFNIAVYRLVSEDGITWSLSPATPVLEASPSLGAWDHRAVETPSVIVLNGQYHMFYTGYATNHTDPNSYKIGHATSSDGITWTKDANFILAPNDPSNSTPNLTFNQWISAEPAAVVFEGKIFLYFSAVGANTGVNTTLQVIGLTTSADGQTWTTPKSVLEPDQTLYPRATWLGYSTPNAVVINDKMYLFFDVVQASPWKQQRIHFASSNDGESSWTQSTEAIFANSQFTWTSNEIRSPSLLLDGTKLHLWFAGDNGSVLGIGQASCAL